MRRANDQLLVQKQQLKEIIDGLSDNADWNAMITFEQARGDRVVQRGDVNLRQDNGDYVTYPNKLGFDVKKLEQLKLKDFYDSNVYLSNLIS